MKKIQPDSTKRKKGHHRHAPGKNRIDLEKRPFRLDLEMYFRKKTPRHAGLLDRAGGTAQKERV